MIADSTLRGLTLKTLFEIDLMCSFYLRIDILEGICGLQPEDFDRVIQDLEEASLIDIEIQHSYILHDNIKAVKITQFGVDVVNQAKKSPIAIDF